MNYETAGRVPINHTHTPTPALTLGPCVADLTHSSHDARNAPGARVPMGSLLAWIPRRAWGSREAHHPHSTQGLPFGTHSHLSQLLCKGIGGDMIYDVGFWG